MSQGAHSRRSAAASKRRAVGSGRSAASGTTTGGRDTARRAGTSRPAAARTAPSRTASSRTASSRTASTPARKTPAAARKKAPTATRPASTPARSKPAAARKKPSRPTSARSTTPRSTASRQAGPGSSGVRRHRRSRRVPLAVAVLVAVAVVGTSFPASALLGEHHKLATSDAQLARVDHQNALLAEQEQQLNAKTEIQRLARQDYQLVLPGESLFNVLPATGQSVTTPQGTTSSGDPANQPLVSPADAPNMTPDPGLPTATTTPAAGGAPATTVPSRGPDGGGFWHRVTTTLEFWR